MKKLICLILVLFLFSCSSVNNNNDDEIIEIEGKYIDPINEVSSYEVLNDVTKNKIDDLYDYAPQNNIMNMYKKEFYDGTISDYYGNTIDFSDYKNKKFVVEISQKVCDHCQKEIPLMETILEKSDDIIFQYFANASTSSEVDEFYGQNSYTIPNDLTVLLRNDGMDSFITDIDVDSTPTFLFVNNGIIEFACIGELSYPRFASIKRLAFENPLSSDEFVTNDGEDIFSLSRTYDDVLNDISNENKDKLALIDNAEELTVNVIGQYVEFYNVYEKGEDDPLYLIDFTKYVNKPLIVFYLGNINDNLEHDISIINEFYDNHKDVNMVTILMDNKDLSTSPAYAKLNIELKTDVVSSNAEVVVQLLDTSVISYPAALFIENNTFTGGVYSIESSETIERAYNTFIGENSIALKENN